MRQSGEEGNILFIILIAVALFAALSFAIMSLNRNMPIDMPSEQAAIAASRILGFTSGVQSGIDRASIANSVTPGELNYANDVYKGVNGSLLFGAMGSPANPSMYVFHSRGGGVVPQLFTDIAEPCPTCPNTATEPGHVNVRWINGENIGTGTADLSLWITSLKPQVCTELNRRLGISGIPVLGVNSTFIVGTPLPPVVPAISASTADRQRISGRAEFCWRENASPSRYILIKILKEN